MGSKSALSEIVWSAYPDNLKAALGWTISTVAIGILPVLLSLLGFLIVRKPGGIPALFTNGEILMVSNMLVCSSVILLGKDRPRGNKHFGGVPFIHIGTLIIAAASFNYGVIRTLQTIGYRDVDQSLVVSMTAILFICGCFYALIVVLIDESLEGGKNFEEVYDRGDSKLEQEFLDATVSAEHRDDKANGGTGNG